MTTVEQPTLTDLDPRVRAFCSADGPEVFRPVAYPTEVWTPDPLDIETIHAEARERFQLLLDKVTVPEEPNKVGRILLLLGEAGSGKTHLMRAFRTRAHQQGAGYFGYMQMTSSSGTYSRYMLHKLIDSLDQPYYRTPANTDQTTGLMRLATAVAEQPTVSQDNVRRLREEELGAEECTDLVVELTDEALRSPALAGQPDDLIKATFFLQCGNPGTRNRAMKYLRGERLSPRDQQRLDIAESMSDDHQAKEMILRLGRLMGSLHGAALILCLDQLETIFDGDQTEERFRRAMRGLISVAAELPNALMVVACLEDYYDRLRDSLDRPALDRIEKDPGKLILQAHRSYEEITQLVGGHLKHLFEHFDAPYSDGDPVFPLPANRLREQTGQTARTVLNWCKDYRELCIRNGGLSQPPEVRIDRQTQPAAADPLMQLDEAWNDYLASHEQAPPDDDAALAEVLAEAVEACAEEIHTGHRFAADVEDSRVCVNRQGRPQDPIHRLQIGICNRSPTGGYLGKQIEQVLDAAPNGQPAAIPIVVRSTDYRPKAPKSRIAEIFRRLFTLQGRYVIVGDSDWRTMLAMRGFRARQAGAPQFTDWLRQARPLARLKSLREILELDELVSLEAAAKSAASLGSGDGESLAPETTPSTPQPTSPGEDDHATAPQHEAPPVHRLLVGWTNDRARNPVDLAPQQFTRHAAFLGSTGSGKTTAALNVIEQLLLEDVPALLVDRKGDLVTYACQSTWSAPVADPVLADRRRRLRERLDIAIYTPGREDGRPLALSAAPDRISEMTSIDRQQLARQAAWSLGEMMGYKTTGATASLTAILVKAIELLSEMEGRITLDALIDYIHEADTALVNAVGMLDTKRFERLAVDLQTLRINKALLFPESGEALDADALFGLGPHRRPGRTRLSVISTKFLGDTASVQFWVAQLLLELGRWMSRNPSTGLQAVVLFDEADVYLPATRKPATKEPMENLLKRARSAGLGVLLATQSPGDFDYKSRENINTWFVGKIKEDTALKKMKPMLSEFRLDAPGRLSGQETGEFFLVRSGDVLPIRSHRSLVETQQVPEDEILSLARDRLGER